MKNNFHLWGTRYPKSALVFSLTILVLFIYSLKDFKSNFTTRIWHAKDSSIIKALNEYEQTFGGDDFFLLGIEHENNLFNQKDLKRIKNLTIDLWKLPKVLRVDSLSNYNDIVHAEDEIIIQELVPEFIDNVEAIEKRVEQIEEIQNILIDQEKKLTIIRIKLKPSFGKNPDYTEFTGELNKLLYEKYHLNEKHLHFLGSVAITNAFKDISKSDSSRLYPVLFASIIIILALYFKTIAGVLIPFIIVVITVIEAFGFLTFKGIEFNSILGSIPGVLLGICLADSIHVLTIFYQQYRIGKNRLDAIKYSLNKNLIATVLTTITTAISFISISFTDLIPIQDLGLVATIGTLLAWINTYTLIPSLILLLPRVAIGSSSSASNLFQFNITPFIIKYKYLTTLLFSVLTTICFYFCFKNQANTDLLKYFSSQTKLRKSFEETEKQLGTIRTHDIVIETNQTDGIKDPQFLKALDGFSKEILELAYIDKVTSILNIIKKMNQRAHENKKEFYRVPESKELVAQLLLLYEMGSSSDNGIYNLISMDASKLNITINWRADTTNDSKKQNDQILKIAQKWQLNAYAAGSYNLLAGVNDKVVESFYQSIMMAIVLVSIVILVVFRNIFYSVLAMIPNFIPLLFAGAFTAYNGIYIDVGSSIVFTICLGIAVDDTIHFLTQFLINTNKNNLTFQKALTQTFHTSGEAIILTTIVLVIGFGIFIFADFLPNRNFGMLSSMVLIFAVITDLIVLPSLIAIFSKQNQITE